MNLIILLTSLLNTSDAREISFSGHINFNVSTNLDIINFQGKGDHFNFIKAELNEVDKQNIEFKNVSAEIPTSSLKTGMILRDQHMQEKIFNDKKTISLELNSLKCKIKEDQKHYECHDQGRLRIGEQTTEVPIEITLSKEENSKLTGQGRFPVELSKLQITTPVYMGVEVNDKVEIDFSFSEKTE